MCLQLNLPHLHVPAASWSRNAETGDSNAGKVQSWWVAASRVQQPDKHVATGINHASHARLLGIRFRRETDHQGWKHRKTWPAGPRNSWPSRLICQADHWTIIGQFVSTIRKLRPSRAEEIIWSCKTSPSCRLVTVGVDC